jgi:3-phytase/alkaline phosphatase D
MNDLAAPDPPRSCCAGPVFGAYLLVARTALLIVLAGLLSGEAVARGFSLGFIGQTGFETGYAYQGTQVGGLSGIDYDAAADRYFVISDDRFNEPPRFYTVEIDLSDGALDDGDVRFSGVTLIEDTNGKRFSRGATDPEAIRFDPDSGRLFWASEGNVGTDVNRFIRGMTTEGAYDGRFVFRVPRSFFPSRDGSAGVRDGLSFESLALSTDRKTLYTATEDALIQDGPGVSLSNGSSVRVLQLDLASGKPLAEFVYEVDPVPSSLIPIGVYGTNGLVELLALDATEFLAVERGFSIGSGYTARVYRTSIAGASNLLGGTGIVGPGIEAMGKALVLDLDELDIPLDNIEGITLGPILPNGRRSLILVSDNNFSSRQQTQFLAFEIIEQATVPVPAPLLLIGLGILAITSLRILSAPSYPCSSRST